MTELIKRIDETRARWDEHLRQARSRLLESTNGDYIVRTRLIVELDYLLVECRGFIENIEIAEE